MPRRFYERGVISFASNDEKAWTGARSGYRRRKRYRRRSTRGLARAAYRAVQRMRPELKMGFIDSGLRPWSFAASPVVDTGTEVPCRATDSSGLTFSYTSLIGAQGDTSLSHEGLDVRLLRIKDQITFQRTIGDNADELTRFSIFVRILVYQVWKQGVSVPLPLNLVDVLGCGAPANAQVDDTASMFCHYKSRKPHPSGLEPLSNWHVWYDRVVEIKPRTAAMTVIGGTTPTAVPEFSGAIVNLNLKINRTLSYDLNAGTDVTAPFYLCLLASQDRFFRVTELGDFVTASHTPVVYWTG